MSPPGGADAPHPAPPPVPCIRAYRVRCLTAGGSAVTGLSLGRTAPEDRQIHAVPANSPREAGDDQRLNRVRQWMLVAMIRCGWCEDQAHSHGPRSTYDRERQAGAPRTGLAATRCQAQRPIGRPLPGSGVDRAVRRGSTANFASDGRLWFRPIPSLPLHGRGQERLIKGSHVIVNGRTGTVMWPEPETGGELCRPPWCARTATTTALHSAARGAKQPPQPTTVSGYRTPSILWLGGSVRRSMNGVPHPQWQLLPGSAWRHYPCVVTFALRSAWRRVSSIPHGTAVDIRLVGRISESARIVPGGHWT